MRLFSHKATLFHPSRISLYKGVFYLVLLRAVQIGMGLASTYFLVRALNKEVFGQYQMVLNTVGLLTVFTLSGLNNSIMQAMARGFTGTYRRSVPIAFLCSLLGSLILLVLSTCYYWTGQHEIGLGFLISASLFPFAHGLVQWKSAVAGQEKFASLLVQDGLASISTYGLIIFAVVQFPGSLVLPIALVFLIPAAQNIVLTILAFRRIPAHAPIEAQSVAYGMKTTVYASLGSLVTHLDRVLLFHFLSPVALATYTAADRIPDLLRSGIQDLSAVLAPRFAKHSHYSQNLDQALKIISLIYGIAIVIFAFTMMPPVLLFIFGEPYSDIIPYAQALICSVAIGNLAALRFRFIRSQIDVRSFRDIILTTTAIRFIAFLALVPFFGLVGVVISVFIYRITLVLIVQKAIRRHIDQPLT